MGAAGRQTERVASGLDVLVEKRYAPLRGLAVGIICNPTAVDRRLRHAADLLHEARGVRLAALFGPEHGVRGDVPYMAAVGDDRDRRTGVPIHSLYGTDPASLRPDPAKLRGLDALVFDIQDVGARYYTFQATMLFCMESAARAKIAFFVLDRPNPIGGRAVEGPALTPGYESFCGVHDVAVRHGMTVGELAGLYREERRLDLSLTVIPCRGWRRGLHQRDTGLPWVFPSPNMPTPDTALVYPGMCLLEGTNVSEGRGTTRPFELFGAPWLDGGRLAHSLAATGCRGSGSGRQASCRPGTSMPERAATASRSSSSTARRFVLSGPAWPVSPRSAPRIPSGFDGGPNLTSSWRTFPPSTFCADRPANGRRSGTAGGGATSLRRGPARSRRSRSGGPGTFDTIHDGHFPPAPVAGRSDESSKLFAVPVIRNGE
jgi:uncharacterized protein YbbC (DUF1343 family)